MKSLITISALQCFPALISTERQIQKRRYGVKTRNIQVIYSDKLKLAYVTANDNLRSLDTCIQRFQASLATAKRRLKPLAQAKDLRCETAGQARIGIELNNAKAKITLMYIEKGYTVLSNIPRPKNKKLYKQLESIA
ncbi:hypothetical protein R2E40_10070 [Aeromonas sp. CD]|uniref:hypothetical protein n=1 Tax=Aeromonas sp. CD TaxID=3080830 RepID=UPI002966B3E1|nr:hypothetical protein [Aeromonas sp. CD]WOX54434.1 hypothetical protein R2E40_10070 [Aeromonas sp. CD]